MLRTCIINFVTNGAQAMPDGGTITLGAAVDAVAGQVQLTFADQGVGISPEDQEKIEKYLSHIKDASRQTFELLQNLLFWARSQTGTMEFRPVVFNLRERIQENVILVEPEAAKKSNPLGNRRGLPAVLTRS